MNPVIAGIVGFACGIVCSLLVFVFYNRTKADQVDKIEEVVRKPLP